LNGLIVRNGYVVAEWGESTRVDMTFSVTKSFLSTVVGLAWQKGLIRDVNDLVREYVPQIVAGTAPRIAQDPIRASTWPRRTPDDGIIDWETRASYLYDWVRAQTRPYPGAFTYLGNERIVVWRARPVELEASAPAGTVLEEREEGPVVACGEGALLLEEIESPAGPITAGTRLG
jgi:methionyl-tRNA formyltransferase